MFERDEGLQIMVNPHLFFNNLNKQLKNQSLYVSLSIIVYR